MRALAPVLVVLTSVFLHGCATAEDLDARRPSQDDAGATSDADDSATDAQVDTGPACELGRTFCGDEPGCRDLANDPASCGACGKTCAAVPHATPTCEKGACGFVCEAGFDDCNSQAADGCEASLLTDDANCGVCGKTCLTSEVCVEGVCERKSVIESFDSETWPITPWVLASSASSNPGTTSAECAHDGARGYAAPQSSPGHYYRTDVTVGAPGTKVSVWYRNEGGGRGYLGFGASASGAWSLTAAPNTNQLMLESHIPWGTYTTHASKTYFWPVSTWLKLEAEFAADGVVTGRVYASDGTTVLETITAKLPGFTPGGIALRAFAEGTCLDTISL